MLEMLNSLPPMLRTYWIVALIATIAFVIQTILVFVGADMDADVDTGADAGDSPLGVFTLKNLINFMLGYGWAGICFFSRISSLLWLNVVAVGFGLLFVLIFFLLITQIMKLAKDGSFRIEQAVGMVGDVYLRVPAAKSGRGKIQVSVRGSVHELDAITDGDMLPTGVKAKIIAVIDAETVCVSAL